MTDSAILGLALAGCGAVVGVIHPVSRRWPSTRPAVRNLGHALTALFTVPAILWVEDVRLAIAASLGFTVFLVLAVEFGWIRGLLAGSRWKDYGYPAYTLGIAAGLALFPEHRAAVAGGFLVLGLADPVASTFGRRFGRTEIVAWGSRRTLEGSLACAAVATGVGLAWFAWQGVLGAAQVAQAVYLGATAAALEATLPSALDNLLVQLWGAFVLFIAPTALADPIHVLAALAVSVAIGWFAWRARWVDAAAAVFSALLGMVALGLGGPAWFLPLLAFMVLSSLLTRFRQSDSREKGPRRIVQVVCNVVPAMLPVFPFALTGDPRWYVLHVGSVAVATADTWATEIGRHARSDPFSLRSLRRVARGVSGAVSPLGLAGSVLGGLAIGGVAALVGPPAWRSRLLLAGAAVGLAGSLVDSLLGAWLQVRFRCAACGATVEESNHCGVRGKRLSGVPGCDNHAVNAAATVAGLVLAWLLVEYLPA